MKYEVIKDFTDKYDRTIKYKVGQIVEFDSLRAKEILSVDKLIKKVTKPKKNKGVVE